MPDMLDVNVSAWLRTAPLGAIAIVLEAIGRELLLRPERVEQIATDALRAANRLRPLAAAAITMTNLTDELNHVRIASHVDGALAKYQYLGRARR